MIVAHGSGGGFEWGMCCGDFCRGVVQPIESRGLGARGGQDGATYSDLDRRACFIQSECEKKEKCMELIKDGGVASAAQLNGWVLSAVRSSIRSVTVVLSSMKGSLLLPPS